MMIAGGYGKLIGAGGSPGMSSHRYSPYSLHMLMLMLVLMLMLMLMLMLSITSQMLRRCAKIY